MGFLDFLFPKKCFGCGVAEKYLCEDCLSKVSKVKPFCPVCERPSIDGMTHVKCKSPQSLDGLVSIWKYEGVVRKTILELKYKFISDASEELASAFLQQLKVHYNDMNQYSGTTLVPIPLHRSRERWRGFNQSEILGKLIAEKMGWQFLPDLLIRKKSNVSQMGLTEKQRKRNIRGVFSLKKHNSSFIIPNSIVLFDDVWTTGSTLKEACKVLKRNGAKIVWGLTICS